MLIKKIICSITRHLHRRKTKCGDFPWNNRWHTRQNKKEPRYVCMNCLRTFRTGKFYWDDYDEYDDICPSCGAVGLNLEELLEEYKELINERGEKS